MGALSMATVIPAFNISRPVMRYHGGKFRLAEWIMGFFPDHDTYVEPFGGAGSLLMRKPRSPAEVYNDLDDEVVNVFRVLRDPEQSDRLKELCALTPYARSEFRASYAMSTDPVEQARRTIFRAAAGFGSAGATKGRTGFRSYSKADRSVTPAVDWASYPDAIPAFCERLRGVIVESGDAMWLSSTATMPPAPCFSWIRTTCTRPGPCRGIHTATR